MVILAIVLVGVATWSSCGRPGDLETVASAVEDSARSLDAGAGVESEVEVMYGVDGPWMLIALPVGQIDVDALARSGVRREFVRQLEDVFGSGRRNPLLIQAGANGLLIRPLPETLSVPRQLVASAEGAQWAVAKLRVNSAARSELVALSVR